MKFLSLQPFVPSRSDFEKSKQLFLELGFNISFDAPGYTGFEKDGLPLYFAGLQCPRICRELYDNGRG